MDDVSVRIIFQIFTCNAIFANVALLIAAIPYYHYFGLETSKDFFIASVIACATFYVCLSYATHRKHTNAMITFIALLCLSVSSLCGFSSALVYNISPIQVLLLWWVQCVAIVCYTRFSPQQVDWISVLVVMCVCTLATWVASLYVFFVENDWIYAGALLGIGFVITIYNAICIYRVRSQFDTSWESGVHACALYFCQDFVEVVFSKD